MFLLFINKIIVKQMMSEMKVKVNLLGNEGSLLLKAPFNALLCGDNHLPYHSLTDLQDFSSTVYLMEQFGSNSCPVVVN